MQRTDTSFIVIVSLLLFSGLGIFVSAAMGLMARSGASFSSVVISQVGLGLGGGLVLMFLAAHTDYRALRPWTPHFFAFALLLTGLTLTPLGISLKGAHRWLAVGPVSFQPEELLKLAAVLVLAAFYATHHKKVQQLEYGVLPLLVVAGLSSVVLLLQPDTDGVIMIGGACAAMWFAAGARWSHLGLLLGGGLVALLMLAMTRPYLHDRLETFLHPAKDSLGISYQTQQSLIAIGSGGLWGKGFGQSIEKFSYLPEPIGDSIFAVAGEEFGFVGTCALVLLFMLFALLGLRIAARAGDPFGSLLVIGLTVIMSGQAFYNIASTIGIVPLSGLPLIFVSHGGTALAVALGEVGIMINVSKRAG